MRLPWFSIRHLMVGVVIVALLIPFPIRAVVLSFGPFALWIACPLILVWCCDPPGKGRVAYVVIAVFVALGSFVLLFLVRSLFYPRHGFLLASTFSLTSIHLLGPLYAGRRLWHDKPLNSGVILWAWLGLVWIVMNGTPELRRSHSGTDALEVLVEFTRVTSVLALFLAIYGKRPVRPDPVWPYYLGWGLAEYDAIVWGWYAVS